MKKDDKHSPLLEVLPTRVRRGYTGGALLEKWTHCDGCGDGDRPEDWIASTVRAVNPGLPGISNEGLTRVRTWCGEESDLAEVIATAPDYYLGRAHLSERGCKLGFLAKILDSAIRLHTQAHPTSAFAQAHLNSRYGKLETYLILAVREGVTPYLRLGFQRSPGREEWRRIIAEQDLAAMDACFDPVPLHVSEVWRVPGGMPHAIGEGVLMLEVMEPSDWVVRCEFTRGALTVPPAGRFMGRDLDFCLQIFDYRAYSPEAIQQKCRLQPRCLRQSEGVCEEALVTSAETDCFTIRRLRVSQTVLLTDAVAVMRLLLVTRGEGTIETAGRFIPVSEAFRGLLAAGAGPVRLIPRTGSTLEAVVCLPGSLETSLVE